MQWAEALKENVKEVKQRSQADWLSDATLAALGQSGLIG